MRLLMWRASHARKAMQLSRGIAHPQLKQSRGLLAYSQSLRTAPASMATKVPESYAQAAL